MTYIINKICCFMLQIYSLKCNIVSVDNLSESIRGGPFDMWGGGYGFSFVIKLFF